jgi:hypothetical protein
MSRLYTHKQNGGLYDWDGENLTKVLPCFEGSMAIPSFITTPFEMNKNYRKATKNDIRKFRLTYYDDNGIKCLYKYNYNDKEYKVMGFDLKNMKYEVLE